MSLSIRPIADRAAWSVRHVAGTRVVLLFGARSSTDECLVADSGRQNARDTMHYSRASLAEIHESLAAGGLRPARGVGGRGRVERQPGICPAAPPHGQAAGRADRQVMARRSGGPAELY